jgi:hypothetical protein
MADYVSRYDVTKRVELGDDLWVDIRTCLTGSQMRAIRKKQITYGVEKVKNDQGVEVTRSVVTNIDADLFAYETAIASIVDWNLSTDGVKWPLTPEAAKRAHYDLLDEADQDKIEDACNELNAEPTRKEDATFPGDSEGSVPARVDQASDDSQVLS